MTLRTPRRRISPRARRRCLAIRNFFQRTFNSLTSPSGIRINSSIALNVTDLKRNVTRDKRPLHAGSQNYRDAHHLGHLSRASSTLTSRNAVSTSENRRRRLWHGDPEQADTKVLYKTTENLGTDSNDLVPNLNDDISDRPQYLARRMNYEEYTSSPSMPKRKSKKNDYDPSRDLERLRSRLGNREAYLIIEKSSSGLGSHDDWHAQQVYQSDQVEDLISACSSRQQFEYSRYLPPDDIVVDERKKRHKHKTKRHKSQSPTILEDSRRKNKKIKAPSDEYITDVINQQYKPLDLFDRKASTFSRISAPVCRDHRYSARDMVMVDSDMYTCSGAPTARHGYHCVAGVSAMRSVCDTRLYSSHRPPRLRHRRRHGNDYNDSSLYDVVPVKEKSSPKSRRKLVENIVLTEVPPSPRTLKHRFNLETLSYSDCEVEECRANRARRKYSPNRNPKPEYMGTFRHNFTSEDDPQNRSNRVSPKMTRRRIKTNTLQNPLIKDQQYYEYPNKVPPSPRTQRPRFNLETQNYSNYEDCESSQPPRRQSPQRPKRPEQFETFRDGMLPESSRSRNNVNIPKFAPRTKYTSSKQDDMGPSSGRQDIAFQNTITHATGNGNVQNGDFNIDRDKTLSEIKNILATFLQELKKDSSTSQSQSDEASGTSNKNSGKPIESSPRESGNGTSNAMRNSTESSFNSGLVQGTPALTPQFVPNYANPYYYQPVMPLCATRPVPCVHSNCMPAVPSCMCVGAACGHANPATDALDAQYRCSRVNCTADLDATKKESETDELIREIYNYVSQNPSIARKVPSKNLLNEDRAARFPASGGKSMHGLRQDAQVGTPLLRCYSKSCEAITSQHLFDTYYAANPSFSDSVLSRETMDAPYTVQRENKFVEKKTPKQHPKQSQHSKFVDALRLLLKNKKDNKEHIHEVCQSEQSIEVDVLPKSSPNFKQHLLAYSMHGQEYLRPPPQHHQRVAPRFEYNIPPYDPLVAGPVSERHPYYEYIAAQSAPMYATHEMQPQIPLCLREVEVRSVGTQSERKAPYFRLFSPIKKAPPSPLPERNPASILRDFRREASKTSDSSETKPRKLFNLNSRVVASKTEPSLYETIQKDLNKEAAFNNTLIKKIFYKRNPFSPQNRFVRTIMEKDPPVVKWRPRPFFL